MAANVGQVVLNVFIRDRSPFSPQPKQESVQYFRQDNFGMLKSTVGCEPVPDPINGIRNRENLQNYHNFIEDYDGNSVGDSTYSAPVTVSTSGNTGTSATSTGSPSETTTTKNVQTQNDAAGGVKQKDAEGQLPQGDAAAQAAAAGAVAASIASNIPQDQKDFFTWQVASNIFIDETTNPAARKFTDIPAPIGSNAPEWTYMLMARPGGDGKNQMLTPFMKKASPTRSLPIHWGLKMKTALAKNQPFEVIYYFGRRDPAVAENATALTTRITFLDGAGNPLDLKLTKSIYLAVEFGIGSSKDHFMIVFKNDVEPMFFVLGSDSGSPSGGQTATLLSTFTGFNASKIFDLNNKFFTVKVEPVLGSLIIRSNAFHDTPWVILASTTNPIFVGKGPLGVYGGNVQAGVAMRPIQYVDMGQFATPDVTYLVIDGDGAPRCSAETKGPGEIEQDRSYSDDGTGTLSIPVVNMADAEKINGSSAPTILEASSADAVTDNSTSRSIDIESIQSDDSNVDPNAQPDSSGSPGGQQIEKTYTTQVTLTTGDVTQGNGYVVSLGRSPYIWMIRCEMAPAPGNRPNDLIDISCDVMSVDLNHNATSYNELSHTGTMRVLNRRAATPDNPRAPIDYRQYTNRAVYVRIEAYWKNGAGKDPGPGDRQIFEGLTTGAEVTTRAENEIITFKLEDYMNALQGSKFVLCPFYDGMKASLAVRDIVMSMGFPDSRILADTVPIVAANLAQDLGLPFNNPFEEPLFRFKDGSSYKEGILKIAKLDFKCVYFDRNGNFHYDTMPGGIFSNQAFVVREKFWSSQIEAAANGDAITDQTLYKVAWNSVTFSRLINDTYNVIQVSSVTKRLQSKISLASAYNAGIFDPTAEGYLGYRKHLMIAEPALGSVDAVGRYLENYRRRVFIPPLSAHFETYGYTGLSPLDVIQLDGQHLRILNISTHLSAAENMYFMNVEGEWFFSAGKDQDPALMANDLQVGASSAGSPGESSTF